MQPITEAIACIPAMTPAVRTMDPPAADMLDRHVLTLRELSSILLECSIQLSRPEIRSQANDHLLDRIDMARGTVPRPVCQVDGS